MLEMQKASADKSSEQQMEMMRQMLDFAKTSAAATAAAATGRMDELKAMKDEYREEAHRQQERTDKTQDKALNYTTKITSAEMKRPQSKDAKVIDSNSAVKEEIGYIIQEFGEKLFSFEQIATYISSGVVTPATEFEVDGEPVNAADISEFYPLLVKFYTVECPVCGSKGLKGTFCPECGSEL